MNIEKDQLFCLLGPNGAGKTTTINCLTGITPATYGDGKQHSCSLCIGSGVEGKEFGRHLIILKTTLLAALIYGNSIRSSVGMSNIRRLIGVCPQVIDYIFHLLSVCCIHCAITNIGFILL